ncbi:hypothetical protein DAPPUDRAFT_191611 [Daphnia pulex]|uniref:Uncharacterized protein n=1 Tax=Daphnia pulex TaxID=6669 RepID=E9FWP7_DAPPU|nr:hypothetical protein DAPPUDRAFT_191611 [Daphnia pulex]|eukprot:EFX88395.1 hypothetical protein DAPPUDRAFT_191611 [Daphnia pulex]
MQYLAAVNNSKIPGGTSSGGGAGSRSSSSLVTEQILEASPLLESFGNATTVRNDNSSRFGKYTQIFFRNGAIAGAKITEYLLEKSRIVTHAADERNYHVFYELLKGLRPEEKERYGLTAADNYFYLNQGGHCESATKHDGQDFKTLLSAMQILGFNAEEQDVIFRILASVLHLGNVFFHRKALKHGQEGVEMGSDAEVRWVSHLLQLRTDGIVAALTTKTTEARNEKLHTPLNIDQALDARDAIAKALYSSLFGWLVNRVNSIVNKGERSTSINILDIFGFEDFPENSFEQLCINYANENLQFYFNKHIFKLEQQEYAKERIEWQTITFTDNQPVISLIAKKPIGVLHLLDDESNFPKATDGSFLEKCHYNHALNELYFRPRMSSMEFGIKHYAGQVWYNADGFLDKNRDTLRPDVVDLLISSRIQMLSRMFQDMKKAHESSKMLNRGDGRFVTMKPRTATVAARFHDSLQALLESMSKCNPWFVRCLKPNREKLPMSFDLPVVLEQLRYTGMLETIRIRKNGYPVRMKFHHFIERYRCLLTRRERRNLARSPNPPGPDICRIVLDRHAQGDQFQLGTTKVFMREALEQQIERKRLDQMRDAAIKIQRAVRTYQLRKDFLTQRRSAVVIQAWVRRYQARKRFNTIRRGVILAQAQFRATRQRRLYKELREELQRREEERQQQQQPNPRAVANEMEREAKAMAGFNHLEIPAELAFIYSKLDDWQPIHSERNVVKVVGAVPSSERERELPDDLDHHAFTKFTSIYFKSHLWGSKRDPIQTPLLPKNSEADTADSLAIFKLILRFANGPKAGSLNGNQAQWKRELALGNYIVHKGIVREQLRDEIYCQICNQTWRNEDPEAVARCWYLMANCLSAFPPSPVLYKYLLKYVSDHAYDGYRAICQQKLMQSYALEPPLARAYPPTVMEWKANRKCVNMALEARYPDGIHYGNCVESWSTAENVASLLMRARGLEGSEAEGWTVSMAQADEFFDLNGQDFVLDVVAELETPPAFPIHKGGHFLNSRNENESPYAYGPPRTPNGIVCWSNAQKAIVTGECPYQNKQSPLCSVQTCNLLSSDVDQYLDDLFMPVLDGNIDEYSDARSLAASIKGGSQKWKEPADVTDFVDNLIADIRPDEDLEGADQVDSLAALIQGGGKGLKDPGQSYSSPSREAPFQPIGISIGTPQQSLGLMSPQPALLHPSPLLPPSTVTSAPLIMTVSPTSPVLMHVSSTTATARPDAAQKRPATKEAGPSTVLARSGSRGQGDQVPAPILPKSRRESGLPVLESRQSFSRAQVRLHTHTHKSSPTFAKCLQTGSLSTSEDAKPEEEIQDSSNALSIFKGRERSVSPVRQLRDVKASPGSIGKLKISSEMRAKLELVTIAHQATSKPSNERSPEPNGRTETGGVRKLEDNRRLMLQQQLSGRKWDSVEESIHTKLYGPLNAPFFTYNNVPWTLHVRKELFSPSENALVHPLGLHLIFCQVVQDTYNDACLRISRDDRVKMQQMLENYGISPENATNGHHKITLKRNVVEMAKEWPLYFARLYPVSGTRQHADVQFLAVSHSGVRLVKRQQIGQLESLHVLQSFGFSDILNVTTPRSSTLQITLRTGGPFQFYTQRATLIRDLVHRFANEAEKEPLEYVKAVANYVTRESTLLSFHKGDVIQVVRDEQYVDKGWMFGKLDGRVGIFPADYVEPMSRIEARKISASSSRHTSQQDDYRGGAISPGPHHDTSLDMTSSDNSRLDDPGSPTQPNDGKHSLLQFALYHFRQSPENKSEKKKNKSKKSKDRPESVAGADWTWKEQVDLVKFTKSPIQASLLQLDSNELNKLALEGFLSIMKYMGDYPMAKGQSEVDSVYTILMNCHKHEALRDETYCQVMKQTTNNKSSRPDSCQRGWRLFSITAAYFSCSEVLKPYLFKYLETAAYDKRRAYHGTAMVCLQNLRKTLRYGGRKNVPSIEEITAITAGRNSKRQMYRLPGGTERVINTKSTSVVQDIIEEICGVINVRSEQEMEEYSLYCIVEGDTFTMPLAREEYILDVTTELQKNQQVYYLIFCRSVWHYPMRLDNALYIEIVFNQIAPDYLEGLLLVMPGEQISQDCVYDIAKVAALLHRAADLDHMPTMKETKYLLPKPALSVRDIKPPQWVNLVQSSWKEVEHFKPSQAKAQVLEVLEKWSLFGSSFFAVRRDADPAERSEHILALNRNGVHFLDVITHETLMHYPYSEVISTRKVKSEEGPLFLDMKCGNLMQQRVTRIQTDQAHEISRLIRQYITIQQRIQQQNVKEESNLASR